MYKKSLPSASLHLQRSLQCSIYDFDAELFRIFQVSDPGALTDQLSNCLIRRKPSLITLRDSESVDRFLSETDAIASSSSTVLGERLLGLRYRLRLDLLKRVVDLDMQSGRQVLRLLRRHPDFSGKTQLICALVRFHIENSLRFMHNVESDRSPNRITRFALGSVTQGEYVRHCMNLLNLESCLDQAQYSQIRVCFERAHIGSAWFKKLDNVLKRKLPAKLLLIELLESSSDLRLQHNTHPASQLLCCITGFVFHPNFTSNLAALLSKESPVSFGNVSLMLCERYLQSLEAGVLDCFFAEAFSLQDPCYEATVENFMRWQLPSLTSPLKPPEKPIWSSLCDTNDNIDALVDWQERVELERFVVNSQIQVAPRDYAHVEQLLESQMFRLYLQGRIEHCVQTIKLGCSWLKVADILSRAELKWRV